MTLYFVTSNRNKVAEARAILGEVEQLDVDVPELQDADPRNIIRAKLHAAQQHAKGAFIVDDTSLHMACLNGLPGPFIKWFLKALGPSGLAELARKLGDDRAEARALVGYASGPDDIHFFEGIVPGRIVPPRGTTTFGWDPIFQPDGRTKTYAEMSADEKNGISHRRRSLEQLKAFLAGGQ
jgi:inosine triphosphate pyrophosphatase